MLDKLLRKIKSFGRENRIKRLLSMFDNSDSSYETVHCGDGYGGFDIVGAPLNNKSIVYSFGIGEDLSFSRDIIDRFDCSVFAFDPTPKSIEYVKRSELYHNNKFKFFEFGLSNKNEIGKFHLPSDDANVSGSLSKWSGVSGDTIDVVLKTIPAIMNELKHRYL